MKVRYFDGFYWNEVDFANWISENKFTKGKDYKRASELLMYSGCCYSTAELFEEFLKTL